MRTDCGTCVGGDAAGRDGALSDEDVVPDDDRSRAVSGGTIAAGVVVAGDEDPVGQHAAVTDRHGVDRVQVDVVAKVDVVTDRQWPAADLDLEPDPRVDGAASADVDAVNAAQESRRDDDRAAAQSTECAGVERP